MREAAKTRAKAQSKAHPERHKDWAKRNPSKVKAQKRRAYLRRVERGEQPIKKLTPEQNLSRWLKYTYGITLEEYRALEAKQGGRCAICRRTPEEAGVTRLAVDHSHSRGSVRGLLCRTCNIGIGSFLESPDLMLVAIDYLKA